MKFGEIEVVVKSPKNKNKKNAHHKYGFPIDALTVAEDAAGESITTNEFGVFGIKRSPKRATIKKKPEKFEPSIQDKIKQRRALANKVGLKKAFSTSASELKTESDLVLDKASLVPYLKDMITNYLESEDDIEKLSKLLKMLVGKEIKSRGSRYVVTREDISNALENLQESKSESYFVEAMRNEIEGMLINETVQGNV